MREDNRTSSHLCHNHMALLNVAQLNSMELCLQYTSRSEEVTIMSGSRIWIVEFATVAYAKCWRCALRAYACVRARVNIAHDTATTLYPFFYE